MTAPASTPQDRHPADAGDGRAAPVNGRSASDSVYDRDPLDYANARDLAVAGRYEAREADWRKGAVVYQVFVDRFAPSADLDAKRSAYAPPKRLRAWDEQPAHGSYDAAHRVWSHELDFWGGDLASLRSRLDYLQGLGVDVVYLCPIHLALTNHGYDALDYLTVRPEYGTRADLAALAADLHGRGMRLVLDGVFNHMGRASDAFVAAASATDDDGRAWFHAGADFPGGFRSWQGSENLPELRIENPRVQEHVYAGVDSVVRSYLRDGVDGWRLDVAHDLGMRYLAEITAAAHDTAPGSLVLGEVSTYPADWFPALDGVLAMSLRHLLLVIARGEVSPSHGAAMLQRLYADADLEHLLMSWVYLDNHDTARLPVTVPDPAARELATVLQFTLPGAVNLYYGSELGLSGGVDPANREPMPWDAATEDNPLLARTRSLIALRRDRRALRVGDLRWLVTDRLIGFERHTDRVADAVVVLVNPSAEDVRERVLLPDSKLMSFTDLVELRTGARVQVVRSLIDVTLPPHGTAILAPDTEPVGGYTPYKRVQ